VIAPRSGTVIAAGGQAAARRVRGVVAADLTVRCGDTVEIGHSFRDRVGYAIAFGSDHAIAAARADRAVGLLQVDVRGQERR
jgi:argininosuccinate lyase